MLTRRRRIRFATLAAVVVVACTGCNPYDRLPRPKCRDAHHCLPGHACIGGYCSAEGTAEVRAPCRDVGSEVTVILVAAPGDVGSPWDDARVRLVATAQATRRNDALCVARFSNLPSLETWALAWSDHTSDLCEGTPYGFARLPRGDAPALTLSFHRRWQSDCYSLPPPLAYADQLAFAGR